MTACKNCALIYAKKFFAAKILPKRWKPSVTNGNGTVR